MTDLPSGWSIIPLIDVIDEIMDYRGRTPRKLGLEWGGGDIKAISARNVRMGYVDFSVEHHLASETLYRRWMTHGDMREGDVLFTTEAPLGNVATVPDGRRYVLSQRTVLMRPKLAVLDRTYFLNLLQSPVFQQTLLENATGSTALGIQRARLEKLPLVVPPLPEQQQVGQAIQDSVELIHSMERLIAKKRAIKQGMMQELLTGRIRLPGFSGQWRSMTFGDVVRIQRGSTLTRAQAGKGRIPVIAGGKIPAGYTDRPNRTGRTITISASGASAGYVAIYSGEIFASDCSTISRSKTFDLDFIYYSLLLRQDAIYRAQTGGAQPHIHARDIYPIGVQMPMSIDEQNAISRVLRDVDDEIATLERRLEAARAIKRGMMQELLTGRTRFAEEVAA